MKKLIVAGVILIISVFGASAQSKIGHINTDEVLSLMPEAAKVDSELKDYQASLVKQGQELQNEADKKAEEFVKDSSKLSASMKEIKRGEIMKLYQRLQNYENEMQELATKFAQSKIIPLRTKMLDAIKAVAKEKGYAYVIDAAANLLLVSPSSDDLLPFVKVKLGIKDVAPKP